MKPGIRKYLSPPDMAVHRRVHDALRARTHDAIHVVTMNGCLFVSAAMFERIKALPKDSVSLAPFSSGLPITVSSALPYWRHKGKPCNRAWRERKEVRDRKEKAERERQHFQDQLDALGELLSRRLPVNPPPIIPFRYQHNFSSLLTRPFLTELS